jgi:hypothetical protein
MEEGLKGGDVIRVSVFAVPSVESTWRFRIVNGLSQINNYPDVCSMVINIGMGMAKMEY